MRLRSNDSQNTFIEKLLEKGEEKSLNKSKVTSGLVNSHFEIDYQTTHVNIYIPIPEIRLKNMKKCPWSYKKGGFFCIQKPLSIM